ncbi:MAG: VWA domain-containing protein [Planctomycetes bacterium]|nr:VWA domain-containing protein [Planctomycetota bacterium]
MRFPAAAPAASLLALALLLAPSGAAAGEEAAPASLPAKEERPRIEVAFVLDTTGSMGGLIETAKRKVWSIANDLLRAKPTPDLRLGLVAYRDRGDEYVTRITPLDADLDRVYADLTAFRADGGGDGPESVNRALRDAVTKLSWTAGDRVLRVIFLVGDAPPHMDYAEDVPYARTCEEAVRAGIVINTLRCGGAADTEKVWTEIARLSEGTYAPIPQEGSEAVATPFDGRIAELGGRMSAGFVAYGEDEARERAEAKVRKADAAAGAAGPAAAPASVAADRWSVVGRKESLDEEADLVGLVAAGKLKVEELAKDRLPESLRGLSPEALKERVAGLVAEREAQRKELADLQAKRAAFQAEAAKKAAAGGRSSFDLEVGKALRAQAARKGIALPE